MAHGVSNASIPGESLSLMWTAIYLCVSRSRVPGLTIGIDVLSSASAFGCTSLFSASGAHESLRSMSHAATLTIPQP
jgi:hypothetical protein